MVCRTCKKDLPENKFGRYRGRNGFLRRKECNPCRVVRGANAYKENPEYRERQRWYIVKKTYGIGRDDYERLLNSQDGRCAICRQPFSARPHIDHCHDSGVVRGLLCVRCNIGLGYFLHSTELMKQAICYLEDRLLGFKVSGI